MPLRCACLLVGGEDEEGGAAFSRVCFPCDLGVECASSAEERQLKAAVLTLLRKLVRHVHVSYARAPWDEACAERLQADLAEMGALSVEVGARRGRLAAVRLLGRADLVLGVMGGGGARDRVEGARDGARRECWARLEALHELLAADCPPLASLAVPLGDALLVLADAPLDDPGLDAAVRRALDEGPVAHVLLVAAGPSSLRSSPLARLARWTREQPGRTATLLLARAFPFACHGLVRTHEDKGEEGEGEEGGLRFLSLNRASEMRVLLSAEAEGLDDADGQGDPMGDELRMCVQPASRTFTRCFWVATARSFARYAAPEEELCALALGPVVGRVGRSSAALLLEVRGGPRRVELHVRDGLSGRLVRSLGLAPGAAPLVLVVDALQPGHCYDAQVFRGDGDLRACFCTPSQPGGDGRSEGAALRELLGAEPSALAAAPAFALTVAAVGSYLPFLTRSGRLEVPEDRAYSARCEELLQELGAALSEPWAGVDLVLHLGCAADLSLEAPEAVRCLALAETCACAIDSESLVAMAADALRDAYRRCWGRPGLGTLLSRGPHLFVCAPVLDLLRALGAASLAEATRDSLSPYCARHLLRIAEQLRAEYCAALGPSSDGEAEAYLCGGRVLVLELRPRLALHRESGGGPDSDLLDRGQLDRLRSALSVESPVHALLLLSPLPLLCGDVLDRRDSLAYTAGDVRAVLVAVCDWMAAREGRCCAVLARTPETAFACRAECSSAARTVVLTQVCCSDLLSPRPDAHSDAFPKEPFVLFAGPYRVDYTYSADPATLSSGDVGLLPSVSLVKLSGPASALEVSSKVYTAAALSRLRMSGGDAFTSAHRRPADAQAMVDAVMAVVSGAAPDGSERLHAVSEAVRAALLEHVGCVQAVHACLGPVRRSSVWTALRRCVDQLPPHAPPLLLHTPGSLAIGLVWNRSVQQSVAGAEAAAFGGDEEALFADLLRSDFALFYAFVRQCVEADRLLNVLAHDTGY